MTVRVLLALVVALSLAACGSQVDPSVVAAAQGTGSTGLTTTSAEGSAGAVSGEVGDVVDGTDPETTTGDGDTSTTSTGRAVGEASGDEAGPGPGGPAAPRGCQLPDEGPGMSADALVIGNAADVSGPQPGIFEAAQSAVRAYAAYVNATGGICGKTLEVRAYDTRTDGSAEQQAYTAGCDEVFAMVGSMSAFDGAGAGVTEECGLPDMRAASVTTERNACSVCFGALPANPGEFQNAIPDMVLERFPEAADHAAMLWINIGAAPASAQAQADIMEQRGMTYVYRQGIDISEFNYAPYVQQMRERGVRSVQMIGSPATMVRLAQTMRQQDWWPDLYLHDPTVYSPEYVGPGGEDVEGTITFTNTTPFEAAAGQPELRLYLDWLERIKPGATPTFFGLFAWSAAKLFVERAAALGPNLSRASLVQALGRVQAWTADGLHSPQPIGPKRVGECWRFLELVNGTWRPFAGGGYSCRGTTVLR